MTGASAGGRAHTRRGAQKRANGEGTIYRRARVYALTRDDARKKLMKLIQQSDLGVPVASVNWTVADYLTYWLGQVVRKERRPKTYQGYEGVVRLHLIPALGRKRLGKPSRERDRYYRPLRLRPILYL